MRIPMHPAARSLNLSNCVAIVAYEVLSQRNYEQLSSVEVIKGADWLEQ
jgi:tRNA (cytidine/uridine-2'-O-)-methyltransferase